MRTTAMAEKSNIKIVGRATPQYMAEWEYYDFYERKKVVERSWPKTNEEIQQFRDKLWKIDFDNLNKTMSGSKVLTAIRLYKGNEIIFDCYCPYPELLTLNTLSTKIVSFKK